MEVIMNFFDFSYFNAVEKQYNDCEVALMQFSRKYSYNINESLQDDLLNISALTVSLFEGMAKTALSTSDRAKCNALVERTLEATHKTFELMYKNKLSSGSTGPIAEIETLAQTILKTKCYYSIKDQELLQKIAQKTVFAQGVFSSLTSKDVDIIKSAISIIEGKHKLEEIFKDLSNPKQFQAIKRSLIDRATAQLINAEQNYKTFQAKPAPRGGQGGMYADMDGSYFREGNDLRNQRDNYKEALFIINRNNFDGLYDDWVNHYD